MCLPFLHLAGRRPTISSSSQTPNSPKITYLLAPSPLTHKTKFPKEPPRTESPHLHQWPPITPKAADDKTQTAYYRLQNAHDRYLLDGANSEDGRFRLKQREQRLVVGEGVCIRDFAFGREVVGGVVGKGEVNGEVGDEEVGDEEVGEEVKVEQEVKVGEDGRADSIAGPMTVPGSPSLKVEAREEGNRERGRFDSIADPPVRGRSQSPSNWRRWVLNTWGFGDDVAVMDNQQRTGLGNGLTAE